MMPVSAIVRKRTDIADNGHLAEYTEDEESSPACGVVSGNFDQAALLPKESVAVNNFVHELAFRKVVSVLNQDALHVFRLVEEVQSDGAKMKTTDVADFCQVLQKM